MRLRASACEFSDPWKQFRRFPPRHSQLFRCLRYGAVVRRDRHLGGAEAEIARSNEYEGGGRRIMGRPLGLMARPWVPMWWPTPLPTLGSTSASARSSRPVKKRPAGIGNACMAIRCNRPSRTAQDAVRRCSRPPPIREPRHLGFFVCSGVSGAGLLLPVNSDAIGHFPYRNAYREVSAMTIVRDPQSSATPPLPEHRTLLCQPWI